MNLSRMILSKDSDYSSRRVDHSTVFSCSRERACKVLRRAWRAGDAVTGLGAAMVRVELWVVGFLEE